MKEEYAVFDKTLFAGSEYVTYEGRFVARFKYVRSNRAGFLKFLAANFTVEEYFAQLDAGVAPLTILETKGHVQAHVAKLLKARGYPVTLAGRAQLINDEIAARAAR